MKRNTWKKKNLVFVLVFAMIVQTFVSDITLNVYANGFSSDTEESNMGSPENDNIAGIRENLESPVNETLPNNYMSVIVSYLNDEIIVGEEDGYELTLNLDGSVLNLDALESIAPDVEEIYELNNCVLKDLNDNEITNVKRLRYNSINNIIQYSVSEDVDDWQDVIDGSKLYVIVQTKEEITNKVIIGHVVGHDSEEIMGIHNMTILLPNDESIVTWENFPKVIESKAGEEYQFIRLEVAERETGNAKSVIYGIRYVGGSIELFLNNLFENSISYEPDTQYLRAVYEQTHKTITQHDICLSGTGECVGFNNVQLTFYEDEVINLKEGEVDLFDDSTKSYATWDGQQLGETIEIDGETYAYKRVVKYKNKSDQYVENDTSDTRIVYSMQMRDNIIYQYTDRTIEEQEFTETDKLVFVYCKTDVEELEIAANIANVNSWPILNVEKDAIKVTKENGEMFTSEENYYTFSDYTNEASDKNVITIDDAMFKFKEAYVTTNPKYVEGDTSKIIVDALRIYGDEVQFRQKDTSTWKDLVDRTTYYLYLGYKEHNVVSKTVTMTAVLADASQKNLGTLDIELKKETMADGTLNIESPTVLIKDLVANGTIADSYEIDGVIYRFRDAIMVSDLNNFTQHTYKLATSSKPSVTAKQNMVSGLKLNDTVIQYQYANNNFYDLKNGTVVLLYAEDLHTVETIDSASLGVTIRMVNFKNQQTNFGGPYKEGVGRTEGLITKTVKENGYPSTIKGNIDFENWFGETPKDKNVISSQEVNHLFLKKHYDESGTFHYSGFENFAHLDRSTGDFTVYEEIGVCADIKVQDSHKRGHFFPYNNIAPGLFSSNTNLISANGNPIPENDSRYNENLYVTKENTDYYFGTYMEAEFAQPVDGMYRNKPMVFEFNGDDDLWVYLDGVLILDIGGIHNAQRGYINFHTGEVHIDKMPKADGLDTTIKEMFLEAVGEEQIDNYFFEEDTFVDGSIHKMQMFYMERGAGSSNLDISFNLPTVPKNSIQVGKELEYSDQENFSDLRYAFKVYAQEIIGHDESYNEIYGDNYVALNSNAVLNDANATPVEFKEDGTFYLKPGQVATFLNFGDERKYYAEEIAAEGVSDLEVVRTTYKENKNMEIDGIVSSIKSSKERKMVHFVNYLNDEEFKDLIIKKQVMVYDKYIESEDEYDIKIYMKNNFTGMSDYVGYYYLKNEESGMYYYKDDNGEIQETTEKKIYDHTSNGVIENIKIGQIVLIDNVLVGTQFYVEEVNINKNYNQTPVIEYKNCSNIVNEDDTSYYVVSKNDDAEVIITNKVLTRDIVLTKKIDDFNEAVVFKYLIKGPFGFEKEVEILFDEDDISNVGFDASGKSITIEDVAVGEYTVVEKAIRGYDLVHLDNEDNTLPENYSKIPFSTVLSIDASCDADGSAYFWGSVRKTPSYSIVNQIRFDENGNIVLSNKSSI